ncbi:hypothetical protein MK805_14240 [Shimazuella sp. AN120528]|uniref:hypothetical protein n=1 Tax=Shimazuella soli TaxID=1892854 RepID=UPI001F0F572A|nr:hypothetical protein [Shimazuella soli]MCH5586098.1 hypothetical protein [Shimazuella soli]
MEQNQGKKRHTGWRILGYICVVLTVLLALAAINNIAGASGGDAAERIGRIIGAVLVPVLVGFFARYCFRRSNR